MTHITSLNNQPEKRSLSPNPLKNLNLGWRLGLGFGVLAGLTLLVVILSFTAGRDVTNNINLTDELRVPSVLTTARAQASLLEMVNSVRGYLVLSNPQDIDDYNKARQDFEANLDEIEKLLQDSTDLENQQRLAELKTIFETWSVLPEQLFELHDNRRINQPAFNLYRADVRPLSIPLFADIDTLIQLQKQRQVSEENFDALRTMVDFQNSFEVMMTNLQAYASTGDLSFKSGYTSRLPININAWETLQRNRDVFTSEQQEKLDAITSAREQILKLAPQIFEAVEGERAYEDLYLFRTQAVPQAEQMLQLLNAVTTDQQTLLQSDLNQGRQSLNIAQTQVLIGGLVAVILAVGLAFIFRQGIVNPVRRLTGVAEQITGGDLNAQAPVESRDEIGILAATFNTMTAQLRQTLEDLEAGQQELNRQNQYLSILAVLSERLSAILDLETLLTEVVDQVKERFNYYHAHIYLMDKNNEYLVMAAGAGQAGVQMKAAGHKILLKSPQSLVARAARTQEIVKIDNVREAEDWLPNPLLPNTYAEMAVPIIVEGEVMGVLDVQQDKIAGLDEGDASPLRSLANQVAVAIRNALLFEQIQFTKEKLEIVADLGEQLNAILDFEPILRELVNQTKKRFGYYHVHIYIINEEHQRLVMTAGAGQAGTKMKARGHHIPLNAPTSLVARAARSKEIVWVANVREAEDWLPNELLPDTYSEMAVPIIVEGKVMGVLDVQQDKIAGLDEGDATLLRSLANQVAVAIHNANLFEQTRQAKEKAEQSRQQAEIANRAKSEFLANMSHELRTPLNGILGYAQILKRNDELNQAQKDSINIIQKSGEHLLTLINDVLDVAKIEANKIELQLDDVHLPSFLETLVNIYQVQAQGKNISFTYQAPSALPSVQIDPKRLRQILLNLLGNAVKFTEKGGVTFRVSVLEAEETPQDHQTHLTRIRFEVEDTGVGISPEQVEKIFQPFEQVGDTARRGEGTGLGLAISRQLAQMMDSEIKVNSQPGQGSIFWLELNLPLSAVQPQEQQPEQKIVGYQGTPRTILVADDVDHNRSFLVNLLESLGFEVVEADNGQEAIAKTQQVFPDLILMDLSMPGMDGLATTQAIRHQLAQRKTHQNQSARKLKGLPKVSNGQSQNVTIIAATARAFDTDRKKAELVGCDDFLVKPIKVDELLAMLKTYLKLEWVYQEDQGKEDSPNGAVAEPLIPPPEEEMVVLFDLALRGNIPELRKRVPHISQLGPKFEPFARTLEQLVRGFKEEEILELIERYR